MSLDNYIVEINCMVEDLGRILSDPVVERAAISLIKSIGEDRVMRMDDDQKAAAFKCLSATPSQRNRMLSRLGETATARVVMHARYLGLVSFAAVKLADDLSYVPGKSYRDAASHCARRAMDAKIDPSLESVLPAWSYAKDRMAIEARRLDDSLGDESEGPDEFWFESDVFTPRRP